MKRLFALCASCAAIAASILITGGPAASGGNPPAQATSGPTQPNNAQDSPPTPQINRLVPPADGRIPVAVVLSSGAEVVDFAGPWGVFEYANIPNRDESPFQLFTVAETTAPLKCSGGLTVVPNYTFANAPQPKIIVIPAMGEPSDALLSWVRSASKHTDLTMSVCTGSFVLAKAGLLSGKTATTHHGA